MGFYERLNMPAIINASETYTALGGSLMDPRAVAAMTEAAKGFVDVPELIKRVDEKAAELTRNEAAHVTTGASAGLVLSAAACLCGSDEAALKRLPDCSALARKEILLYRGEYLDLIPYWRMIANTGASLVTVEPSIDALRSAINAKTAAIFLFPGTLYEKDVPDCEETLTALAACGVPIVVDAAAQLPPVSNLWHYTRDLGASLCVFSGGKHIRGPQSTGLIVGKRALVDAARLAACPNPFLGRAFKTGKEELAGFLTALEIFVTEGGDALFNRQLRQLERLADLLREEGIQQLEITNVGRLGTEQPLLHALLPQGKTGEGCNQFTRKLPHPVDIGFYGKEFGKPENLIFLNAYNLTDEQVEPVARAVGAYVRA